MVVAIRSFHRSRSSGVMAASSARSVASATAGRTGSVAEGSEEAIDATLAGAADEGTKAGAGDLARRRPEPYFLPVSAPARSRSAAASRPTADGESRSIISLVRS